MRKTIAALLGVLLVATPVEILADCVDLSKSKSFTLTRKTPYFEVSNKILSDGSVIEDRHMIKNGVKEKVKTTYWNGVIAVDRKSKSSQINLVLSEEAKKVDLDKAGKSYNFPMSIFVNGKEIDRGSIEVKTVRKTKLPINGCDYGVMVVRTSIKRKNGDPINEEALISLDAGMLLGNVAMTPNWTPKHGVFFDSLKAN